MKLLQPTFRREMAQDDDNDEVIMHTEFVAGLM